MSWCMGGCSFCFSGWVAAAVDQSRGDPAGRTGVRPGLWVPLCGQQFEGTGLPCDPAARKGRRAVLMARKRFVVREPFMPILQDAVGYSV